MKAFQKAGPERGGIFIDAPIPKATGDMVVCKVLATSICGTDVHIYNWDQWSQKRIKPPLIFGHEFCGEVVEVGPLVRGIKVGDRISAETHIPCHVCKQCRTGNMHICRDMKILGVDTDGCFAEYAAVPEICCIKNADIPPEIASIQEPLGNATYTVSESNVAGKKIAIFGDGPIGLFATLVARKFGATKIYAVGATPYRMEIMKKLGPDMLIDASKTDAAAEILDATHGDGVDVVLEMSGAASAIHAGLKCVSMSGTFTFFGIPSKPTELDLGNEIIMKGIKMHAIVGRKMFQTWYEVANLIEAGLDVSSIITHTFPLAKIDEAMSLLSGDIKAGKIILKP